MDSSLASDFVMASQLHDHGEIDDESFNVYVALLQEMQANVNGTVWNGLPDLTIYLKIDAEHAISEIQKRGRKMENIKRDPSLVLLSPCSSVLRKMGRRLSSRNFINDRPPKI